MPITTAQLMLIDMLVTQALTIHERIAKVKAMNDEEVREALVAENARSKQLKDLLEAVM